MAFQPVPNVASFVMVATGEALLVEIQNTIYVRNTTPPGWDVSRLTATATAIGNAWRDSVCPLLASTYLFDRVDARDEGSEFGQAALVEYSQAGGKATDPASPMQCAWVKLTGSAGSAPRRGGLFISQLVEADLSASFVATTLRTALDTAMGTIDTAISGIAGNAWVIISRYSGTDVNGNPIKRASGVSNTIASRATRALVATQRDRRPGIGS